MAQTGYTPIQLYHSTTPTNQPLAADLQTGELAFNVADGKLYYKDLSNVVQLLTAAGSGGGTVTSVSGSGGTTGLTLTGGPISSVGTLTLGGTLGFANGGTGNSSYTDGQLLIGNTATGGLTKATLTAGSNVTITNGNGTITIASTGGGGGGSVTAVNASYPITVTGTTTPTIGIANVSGAVTGTTGTGALVFAGNPTMTLANATGLPLTTGVTGILPVANGGTGVSGSTGTGNVVLSTSPTLVTPALGTPSAINLANATGLTSGQVTSALGYTPYSNTNPNGYVTSSGSVAFATNSGNASTVSNGVYTTGSQTITGQKTFAAGSGATSIITQGLGWYTSNFTLGYDGSSNLNLDYPSGGSTKVQFSNTGSANNTTGVWGVISDARIKENITPARNYLDSVCQLNVVNYNLIGNPQKMLGFVAQDVEQVMPGLVETSTTKTLGVDGLKSVKASVLIPMLVQAVQELKAEIDSLKAAK